MTLKAPFPWFGGKSRVASLVWERFGPVPNYVEPFAGSLAVMLGRPHPPRIETVNDIDCYLSNFWRAVKYAPDDVAAWADDPVNESDLHARHLWLVNREKFRELMKTDPDYFDAKIAGWWVWGISCWIGSGWCSDQKWNGRINGGHSPRGIHQNRKRPRISGFSDAGVHSKETPARKRPGLKRGERGERGVCRQLPDLSGDGGAAGRGIHASGKKNEGLFEWMAALSDRLRRVRVCCGDWKRILGPSPTECIGITGVFLDPPYSDKAGRDPKIYSTDDLTVAHDVRAWAIENGGNPKLRIALCGYDGEHKLPDGWTCLSWKANGGHGNVGTGRGRANAMRERIWFSPHCLSPNQPSLFAS